ncbi:MAG: BamA/TamA family outer membrane protein [Alphaproteobacteria bacterium]|nr:BamA/TamA family outer membrane protein [Alphaproteobacteria bacterium]
MRVCVLWMAAVSASVCATTDAAAQTPVRIEGVSGDLLEDLQALLPERETPRTLFDAERIAEEAAARATAFLRSEGYYAAQVVPQTQEDPPAATLSIDLGERYVYAPATLSFEGAAPAEDAAAELESIAGALAPGRAARAEDVLQAEARLIETLRARGYPEAEARPRRVVVDHAAKTMQASFAVNAGAAATLGVVRVSPTDALRADVAQRMAPWEPGAPYSPDALTRLRRAAASTGVYGSVRTTLNDAPDEAGRRDVVLALEPRRPRTLEAGAGYSTTDGFGLDAEWTRRNRRSRAEQLTVAVRAAELQQSIDASLSFPFSDDEGRTTTWSAGVAREDAQLFSRQGGYVGWSADARPRQNFGLSYGVRLSADTYSEAAGVENALVASTFVAARRDVTDEPLDAQRGHILDLRVEPSIATGDQTTAFVRTLADARNYSSFGEEAALTLAARARAGWIEPLLGNASDLPLDRLFYSGGGGSVRGYEYNSIAPDNVQRTLEPPGGRGLIEASVEARYRFTDRWGAAAFVDGGNAYNDLEDALELRWGAGLGVRYDLGFAPLRVDFAVPLNRRDTDESFAIYVSIGQAF